MIKFVKYIIEIKRLKRTKLQLEIALLGKFYNFSEEISKANKSGISIKEAVDIINKVKGASETNIADVILKNIKNNGK